MKTPMSLRTLQSEKEYNSHKQDGQTTELAEVPAIHEFLFWRVIPNHFPYDIAFKEHLMLIPKRVVPERWDLTADEKSEFESILHDYVYPNFDLWFENSPSRRSMNHIYHVHIATYYDDRDQMKL